MNEISRADFVSQAFRMHEAVSQFAGQARGYFYLVALSGRVCLKCDSRLEMIGESRCQCIACRAVFDPTLAFQRCTSCGGKPELRVRRYECSTCGADIQSRFVFDGLVFDSEYFRQKMIEHRERARQRLERVRAMLVEGRSNVLSPGPLDLSGSPGLLEALDGLVGGFEGFECLAAEPRRFDLRRYQAHVRVHTGLNPLSIEEIPPLEEDRRLDRIWRFIAIIFLMHEGLLLAWQEGSDVMVMQRETNGEGQNISGDLEEADGVEGFVG